MAKSNMAKPNNSHSPCHIIIRNGSSVISGCSGDNISTIETKDGLKVQAQGCTIDIKCQPGRTSCIRTINCPGMESLIAPHEWKKRYNFRFE